MAGTDSKDAHGADATPHQSPTFLADDEPRGADASVSHRDDGQPNQNQSSPPTTASYQASAAAASNELEIVIRNTVGASSSIDPTLASALGVVWEEKTKVPCNWEDCVSRLTEPQLEALASLHFSPAYSKDTAQQYVALIGTRLSEDWDQRFRSISLRDQLSRSVSPD